MFSFSSDFPSAHGRQNHTRVCRQLPGSTGAAMPTSCPAQPGQRCPLPGSTGAKLVHVYNNSSSLTAYGNYVEIWMSSQGKSDQRLAVLLLAEVAAEGLSVHYHNSDGGVPDGVVEPVHVHLRALVLRKAIAVWATTLAVGGAQVALWSGQCKRWHAGPQ